VISGLKEGAIETREGRETEVEGSPVALNLIE